MIMYVVAPHVWCWIHSCFFLNFLESWMSLVVWEVGHTFRGFGWRCHYLIVIWYNVNSHAKELGPTLYSGGTKLVPLFSILILKDKALVFAFKMLYIVICSNVLKIESTWSKSKIDQLINWFDFGYIVVWLNQIESIKW
jgi:hypothetical protein